MNIHVSTTPRHLVITQTMIEELIFDPVMAFKVILSIDLDFFQACRARYFWWVPDVEDDSGIGAGKTIVDWGICVLRAILLPGQEIGVIYQNFGIGKETFWGYFNKCGNPIYRAQLGQMDMEGEETGKDNLKGSSCFKQHFKNKSVIKMPAPGFVQDARGLGSLRLNTLLLEEWTKVLAGGSQGIETQLLGRLMTPSFNQHHPIWANHTIRTAAAELGSHPAFPRHQKAKKNVRKADPDVMVCTYNYKHYSGKVLANGKTCRETYRIEKNIKRQREELTVEKFKAEVLGFWSRNYRGWITESMVSGCVDLGRLRRLEPVISRASDRKAKEGTRYFLGVDPAPAEGQRSDRGTLVAVRANPRVEHPGEPESDWDLDPIYARLVLGADLEEWSGIIHKKHADFGFSGILMDWGGGGQFLTPFLRKARQMIDGVEVTVMPIVSPEDQTVTEAHFILYHLLRRDEGLRRLWPDLEHARGDDVAKYLANVALRNALEKQQMSIPPPHNERTKEELAGWPEEKMWASILLNNQNSKSPSFARECMDVLVATNDDGSWLMTKNNALQFSSRSKDDLHDAGRNALLAFKIWVKTQASEWSVPEEPMFLRG